LLSLILLHALLASNDDVLVHPMPPLIQSVVQLDRPPVALFFDYGLEVVPERVSQV
jgi:hypothetical protein